MFTLLLFTVNIHYMFRLNLAFLKCTSFAFKATAIPRLALEFQLPPFFADIVLQSRTCSIYGSVGCIFLVTYVVPLHVLVFAGVAVLCLAVGHRISTSYTAQ
jgi:hypothetical protein